MRVIHDPRLDRPRYQSGDWSGPSGEMAVWEIRDGALVVHAARDGKILALIPLRALAVAMKEVGA